MDKLSEKALEILENKYFGEVIAGEEEKIIASALNLLWKYETEFSYDSESMDKATKYWLDEHKKESQKFEPSWSTDQREEQTRKVHMIARAVRACSWLAQEEGDLTNGTSD